MYCFQSSKTIGCLTLSLKEEIMVDLHYLLVLDVGEIMRVNVESVQMVSLVGVGVVIR